MPKVTAVYRAPESDIHAAARMSHQGVIEWKQEQAKLQRAMQRLGPTARYVLSHLQAGITLVSSGSKRINWKLGEHRIDARHIRRLGQIGLVRFIEEA